MNDHVETCPECKAPLTWCTCTVKNIPTRILIDELLGRGFFGEPTTVAEIRKLHICPHWGQRPDGHYGPCRTCIHCLVFGACEEELDAIREPVETP